MKVGFFREVSGQAPYTSGSQNARAWSERWVRDEMYCPNCGNSQITQFKANRPVADFLCSTCSEEYEIKSQKTTFGSKVLDGAFRTMQERLKATNHPNLVLINYDLRLFSVTNAFIIPKHFFVQEIIEERPPLAPTARRAGWVGCNILLNRIPEAGRIFLVRNGEVQPRDAVLDHWKRTLFLREESAGSRGWLMEVMSCVDLIGKRNFP